jgi:hypothetical protein
MKDGTKKIIIVGVIAAIAYAELGPLGLVIAGLIMMVF